METVVPFHTSSLSFSNGNCLEVGVFRKSSHSMAGNGGCVEAGAFNEVVCVRDTKQAYQGEDPVRPVLQFSPGGWAVFLDSVRWSLL